VEKNGAQTAVALDNANKRYLILHKNGRPTPRGALSPAATPSPPTSSTEGKSEEKKSDTSIPSVATSVASTNDRLEGAAPATAITTPITAGTTTTTAAVSLSDVKMDEGSEEKDDPMERELDVDGFMAKPIESMTSPG
jgi:hypothetical protein